VLTYAHGDLDSLEAQLAAGGPGALIVTDGLFSMHGDLCDLPGLRTVANRHGARLMVDDAHSVGILGATGALIAPIAGRVADRRGSRAVVTLGLTLLSLGFCILWLLGYHILGLVIGPVLLSFVVALVRFDDFLPRLERARPALRQEQRSVHLVDAMNHDFERVADFEEFRVDGEREFAERKDAFGFSADVNQ